MFVLLAHLIVLAVIITCWFLAEKETLYMLVDKRDAVKAWLKLKLVAVKDWFVKVFAAIKAKLSSKKAE